MCRACYAQLGEPVFFNEDVAEAAELIKRLYELEPMGGPLHVQLDDMNLDGSMKPYYSAPDRYASDGLLILGYPDRHSPEVHEICDRIEVLMTPMTESQRAACVAHFEGWAIEGRIVKTHE